MPEKPSTAAGYPPDQVARVKATCLYLATKLGDLMNEARTAMAQLREDFSDLNDVGPRRVAAFLYGRADPETQADAVGYVRSLLEACGR